MSRRRDYVDAEFEVVSGAPRRAGWKPWVPWAKPPEWDEWGRVAKAVYVLVYGLLSALVFAAFVGVRLLINH